MVSWRTRELQVIGSHPAQDEDGTLSAWAVEVVNRTDNPQTFEVVVVSAELI